MEKNKSIEILFNYLQEAHDNLEKATLDIDSLEEDYKLLGQGITFFIESLKEYSEAIFKITSGDLTISLEKKTRNPLMNSIKALQSNLKHLTWQAEQVAKGDYNQQVDFMGKFSDSFNQMIRQLEEREKKLEEEVEVSKRKTIALSNSNHLFTNISENVPYQIIVVDPDTNEIIFVNRAAKEMMELYDNYVENFLNGFVENYDVKDPRDNVEMDYISGEEIIHLSISYSSLEWNDSNVIAFVVEDISAAKRQMKVLEGHAYTDALTGLYNRFYAMLKLDDWVHEKRKFVLTFVDLDGLKFVNDEFGHNEGDIYIKYVAKHLRIIPGKNIISRLGGDEFMILMDDMDYDVAETLMDSVSYRIANEKYLVDKDFTYSISYGMVAVDKNNTLTESEMLSIADERMYEYKRARKKERKQETEKLTLVKKTNPN